MQIKSNKKSIEHFQQEQQYLFLPIGGDVDPKHRAEMSLKEHHTASCAQIPDSAIRVLAPTATILNYHARPCPYSNNITASYAFLPLKQQYYSIIRTLAPTAKILLCHTHSCPYGNNFITSYASLPLQQHQCHVIRILAPTAPPIPCHTHSCPYSKHHYCYTHPCPNCINIASNASLPLEHQ